MFSLAELCGLRPDASNPRRHIRKYPAEKRERYLRLAELAVLGEALSLAEQEGVEDPYAIAAIRLLIFTGCRLNEIMTLKWSYVDFKARCLRLPDLKTGARIVHLGAPALEVLARLGAPIRQPLGHSAARIRAPGGLLRRWLADAADQVAPAVAD